MNKITADSARNTHARSIVKARRLRKEATLTKMTVVFLSTHRVRLSRLKISRDSYLKKKTVDATVIITDNAFYNC